MRRVRPLFVAAAVVAATFAACDLNPQPLPPSLLGEGNADDDAPDGGRVMADAATPPDRETDIDAGDAAIQPASEAGSDAGDSGDPSDASDAEAG